MPVLLPRSEGESATTEAAPVDLAKLAFGAELTESRRRLPAALAGLSAVPLERAVAMLGISAGQAGEVAVDAGLAGAPVAPAAEVYTGILYDRLALRRRRSARCWSPVRSGAWCGRTTGSPTTDWRRGGAARDRRPGGPLARVAADGAATGFRVELSPATST